MSDAKSDLPDAKSALSDAKSALSDAKSALSDAKSALSDAKSALSDAKSAPSKTTSHLPNNIVSRYAGTFGMYEGKEMLEVYVSPEEYTPFQKLMPYITWNGHFYETDPMQTSFKAPLNKKQDVLSCMIKAGYVLQTPSSGYRSTIPDEGDGDL